MLHPEISTLMLTGFIAKAEKLSNKETAKRIKRTADIIFRETEDNTIRDLMFALSVEQSVKNVLTIFNQTYWGLKQGNLL